VCLKPYITVSATKKRRKRNYAGSRQTNGKETQKRMSVQMYNFICKSEEEKTNIPQLVYAIPQDSSSCKGQPFQVSNWHFAQIKFDSFAAQRLQNSEKKTAGTKLGTLEHS
jgi:hypothetical protein